MPVNSVMNNYTYNLNSSSIRGLAVFNVILWIFSSILNAIICVRYSNFGNGTSYDPLGALDYVSVGIWAGLLYGIAGLLGLCGSYNREKLQLKTAAVFNALSIGGAISCACISGIIGSHIVSDRDKVCNPDQVYPPLYSSSVKTDCIVWATLEFVLMGVSIAASVANVASMMLIVSVFRTSKKSSERNFRRMDYGEKRPREINNSEILHY